MTITRIMYAIEDIAKFGTKAEQDKIRQMVCEYYNDAYQQGMEDAK